MSNRDESTGTDEEMRPLPDGGLSEAMPDWLRRPPAWRELPRKDEPITGEKPLPEPDTSVIDPRDLVTIDDLPQWLRDIAARDTGHPEPVVPPAPAQPEPTPPTPGPAPATPAVTPAPGTALWIWAMRAAIILIILAIIFYVFIL